MYINKGLWNQIEVEGFNAALGINFDGKTHFLVVGPGLEDGNPHSAYSPLDEGVPQEGDTSKFANLLRVLQKLVEEGFLDGPFGEDHPAVFRRFNYFTKHLPEELLERITMANFSVKITKIDHKGDQEEVDSFVKAITKWIDTETTFKRNPIEVEVEKKAKENKEWQIRYKKAEKADNILRRFVFYPILLIAIVAIWSAVFPVHWLLGSLGIGFCSFCIVHLWRCAKL